jgi:hypothetical protein
LATHTFDVQVVVTTPGTHPGDRYKALEMARAAIADRIAKNLLLQLGNTYAKSADASENQTWPTTIPNVVIDITATES